MARSEKGSSVSRCHRAARERFFEGSASDKLEHLRDLEGAMDEVDVLTRQIDRGALTVAKEEGVLEEVFITPPEFPSLDMTDAEKAAFIEEHTIDAFKKLVTEGPEKGAEQ